jgi:ATP-binding cassette subfamily B protein
MIEFLKSVDAFSAFDSESLKKLVEGAEVRSFRLGETVARAGEAVAELGVVAEGRVRLFHVRDGREESRGVRGPGDTLADLFFSPGGKTAISARASGDARVIFFPGKSLERMFRKNPRARDHLQHCAAKRACGDFLLPILGIPAEKQEGEIGQFLDEVGVLRLSAGQYLFQEGGGHSRNLYVVRSGSVRLIQGPDGEGGGPGGTVLHAGPGDLLGSGGCLADTAHSTSAVVDSEAILLEIPGKAVREFCDKRPEAMERLDASAEGVRRQLRRLSSVSDESKSERTVAVSHSKRKSGRALSRFPLVRQSEAADCGAACLSMACKYFGLPGSLVRINEMAKISERGATLESLAAAADSVGLSAKGLKTTFRSLQHMELPVIAHWKGRHFVVVYGVSADRVRIADPAKGFRKMDRDTFEAGWTGYCLAVAPNPRFSGETETESPWRRFFRYLEPLRRHLADLLLAAFIMQALGLVPALVIQNILDRVVVHQSVNFLNVMMAGLAIAMVFRQVTGFLSAYLMNFLVRKLDFSMMSNFYEHILSLPLSFFARRKTGDIIARFHENHTIRRFMTQGSISTILNAVMLFTYFTVMFFYNATLSMMLLAFLPPIILLTLLAAPKYRDYARKVFFAGADAESSLVETLGAAELVKGMAAERPLRMRWERKYAKAVNIQYQAEIFTATIRIVSTVLQSAATLTLLYFGTRMVLDGELSIGQLMAFNVLIGGVMGPVMGLVGIWDQLQEVLVSMERLGDVLDLPSEQDAKTASSRILLPGVSDSIRFEKVFFRYRETGPYLLKNIELTLRAGETVAVVGPSGSGKTTLIRLLTGFYRPTEGKVLVDDIDLDMVDHAFFRRHIGYVMQNGVLLSGTVTENIAPGDPEPDPQRVARVARMANADGFIRSLPEGYHQILGERGVGLSGGQAQRISIARALYHNPSLLILDEATSSLDSESENRIRAHLREFLADRTAVVVAHRMSTAREADRIVVMYEGAVVEEGTHEELWARRGVYHGLAKAQSMEPEAEGVAA